MPEPPAAARGAFEQTLGLKVAGWAGAIVVGIGAALGIKFAKDQGWLGNVPPAAWLALMSLGGLALIAAGEVVYRRVGQVAAAGLFGAGVAVLFVVSFAGHRYYGLYPAATAYGLTAAAALVGAAVAVRGNLVSIAVLSIVGGNVAPLVLRGGEPGAPFYAYLLMLQAVALALSWYGRGGKWWVLRFVSLPTTAFWMYWALVDRRRDASPYGSELWFLLTFAALFQAELVLSAFRRRDEGDERAQAEAGGLGATFSVLVTAALTAALIWLFRDEPRAVRGLWSLELAGCCAAAGFALARGRRGQVVRMLSVAYRVQAAALLVASVPITLSGVWITASWAGLAIAFALLGAALDLPVSRRAAAGTWLLAVGHLLVWSLPFIGLAAAQAPWLHLAGQPIPAYLVMAALLTLAGHGIALLLCENWSTPPAPPTSTVIPAATVTPAAGVRLEYESAAARPAAGAGGAGVAGPFEELARVMRVAATVVFAVAATAALSAAGATFALAVYGWMLLAAERLAPRRGWLEHGAAVLGLAVAKWLVLDTLVPRLGDPRWVTRYTPVLNPLVGVGALLLASAALAWWLWPRSARSAAARPLAGFAAVLILLWLGTMEIDRYFEAAGRGAAAADAGRAKQMALSIFWSVFAVGSVAAGFAARSAPLRYFGLGLLAVTLGKVVLVDLGDVGTGYRILSFLGLGLLLLGTSVLYGKLSPLLLGRDEGTR